jgi:NAD(P) transhydrogenase subunit alpha
LGEDASELYAKNQYNLLALMLKNNIITIDWTDEVLAGAVLTHAGVRKNADATSAATATGQPATPAHPSAPTTKAA